jgi:hypothetical protein
VEIAFEVNTRQPDSELVKHHSIRQADCTKKLGLSEFEEVNVRAVKDDARGVNITPTNALLNCELFKGWHAWYLELRALYFALRDFAIKM